MLDYSEVAIAERIKNGLEQPSNRIEGSFASDNVGAVSEELSRIYNEEILPIPDDVLLDTAEGIMLDRKAVEFAEKRKFATYAMVELEFTGTVNAVIPKETIVSTEENIEFLTMETAVIGQEGTVTVGSRSVLEGTTGNVKENTITVIKSYLSDIEKVINRTPASGGVDEETDEAFRSRIYEKIRKPIAAGNKNYYKYLAKQVPGIGEARVIDCPGGVAGTVEVIVLSDQYDTPSEQVVNNVIAHIEENRLIGASVTITKAIPKLIRIKASVVKENDISVETIKVDFEREIKRHLKNICFKNDNKKDTLSFYKLGEILFSVKGISDINSYTLNDNNDSLTAEYKEFFKLAEVVITNGS